MAVIQVDIISDFTCAWCFVAKRNLESAMALYNKTYPGARTDDSFAVTYRPYFLHHGRLNRSVPRSDLIEQKLGHLIQERRDELTRKMNQAGRAVGISFRYGGMIGPTRDAHRLVHASRGKEGGAVQMQLVEELLGAFHERERDIANRDVLREVALAAGLTGEEVEVALTSDKVAREVDEEQVKYRDIVDGKGVPVYIIQGQHRIDGAQDPGELMETFIKVKEQHVA